MDFNPHDAYQFGLLPLVVWREARNQGYGGMLAVAWAIRNRVHKPGWWGSDWPSVILRKWQFSSFNWDDPQCQKFPTGYEAEWQDALKASVDAFTGAASDPTGGAESYYDKSLDSHPPKWATDGSMVKTADIGAFHFFRAS